MAIKSNLEKHTVSWLKREDAQGRLNKEISIQRKEVWDAEKKSNLIVSLLMDIPLESLLFEENGHGHNVLDGKQRTLALCGFLDDDFALSERIRVKEIEGASLPGLTFSQLPEPLRQRLTEYELSISILRPLTREERAVVFFMRNQAVALSKMDLSRVLLGQESMDRVDALCAHPFMRKKIKLTEPARRKREDVQALLQYLMLEAKGQTGLSGREIMAFCDEVNAGQAAVDWEKARRVLDYLDQALPAKRQYLKKVHLPVVLYVAGRAMDRDIAPRQLGERLDAFMESLSPQYQQSCKAGSAKRASVTLRVGEMMTIAQ